ncbi:2-oxo-4-hydroxy-4-carboxy-5-ureidoimidazoline decarboxylase [Allokutzneria sp. A3M-2-11 16]|uniref:2-oxo-4-hydroxy-4-carboxy-5-ureidoimidazoline decarboxylase n=1 Tax=Allokutzneria sp. A3M-2-11 16 TaxID=2962043 RepID=UPI0020B8A995|nr:2-oxo-4-hydroxy-4-carboxy-5-ureidoimidazoline decarboxylase [Allokutzneria sp. A3M-2-11 16]MCP3801537.1 2-oxo-4-hydroxy-4-carboxy-5-ureidoimidazoline decarboxylase [Allokutzneria sp. A3M-2-11 16]
MSTALDELNARPDRDALLACCANPLWAERVARSRPFPDADALVACGAKELAALDWDQLKVAVDAHPRIGQRAGGDGREARWSRGEQSAAATEDERVRAELVAGNIAYEDRFGHVFLICATGLSAAHVLAALRERLDNDETAERAVVREELDRIVELRLRKLVAA